MNILKMSNIYVIYYVVAIIQQSINTLGIEYTLDKIQSIDFSELNLEEDKTIDVDIAFNSLIEFCQNISKLNNMEE